MATTDLEFFRWTQWIFLQIFEAWYDTDADRARPIAELVAEFAAGTRSTPDGRAWAELTRVEQHQVLDGYRLAYIAEAPVNWCPGLGTVLSNEEVTADGRSEIGNFPVFRRNLRQWMMRITAYADRLLDDLDRLDWPESVKTMQRNWIGRSDGANVQFPIVGVEAPAEGSTGARRTHRGVHHPAGHPVRRDLHGAGPGASAGGPDRRRRVAGRCGSTVDRRRRDPGRGGRRLPARPRRASPNWTVRRAGTRPASSPAATRSTR